MLPFGGKPLNFVLLDGCKPFARFTFDKKDLAILYGDEIDGPRSMGADDVPTLFF